MARSDRHEDEAGDVRSPCIGVCTMNAASGLCEGCLRTIDEIANWSLYDNGEKRAVWAAIEERHADQLSAQRVRQSQRSSRSGSR